MRLAVRRDRRHLGFAAESADRAIDANLEPARYGRGAGQLDRRDRLRAGCAVRPLPDQEGVDRQRDEIAPLANPSPGQPSFGASVPCDW